MEKVLCLFRSESDTLHRSVCFHLAVNAVAWIFANQIVIHSKLQNRMDQIVDAFQGIGSKPLLQQFSVQQFDIAFMDFGKCFFCDRFVLNIVLPEIAVVGFRRFFQIGLCFHIYLEEII